jgi:putative lipase involved disintegration of autophagic bodies
MYIEVADQYPEAAIWLSGHSLGGAIASLVGQTFGVPTITADPLFGGVCTVGSTPRVA